MATRAETSSQDQSKLGGIHDILPPGNPFRAIFSLEPIKTFIFLILSFIIGLTVFVVYVTIAATGIGLTMSVIMAIIGIPLLGALLLLVPVIGWIERERIGLFTGFEIASPYREVPDGKIGDRAIAFLSDGALWRDLLYSLLLFPIGLAQFVIGVVGFTVPVSLIISPYLVYAFGSLNVGGAAFTTVDTPAETIPLVLLGLVLGLATAYIFIVLARAHAVFARWLIGPDERRALAERVETLSETRSRMVGVSLDDRRNIERDIHDSTQPKLVNLAMSLGMAKEKIDSDPQRARELIDTAHNEAREVLAEIRNLVRGLHPSILTDRGLEAAIRSLSGYCAVPVQIDVNLGERPPEAVETTAYYIIAESLTNVAKHSQATEARVMVRVENGNLLIEIEDDGIGGAVRTPASGLSGLQDRAAALDGRLTISSPVGGPTRISARLPCES
ncbi:MAG: sensor histidine kinase [Sphaerobacteraceae bacterium]|nr:MAG: sensor histidine kinase [Sphaerobacteraceae bacterium]